MVFHDSRLVFHGSRSVFMVFHGSRLVFHGARLLFMIFHGIRLVFMVPGWLLWFFIIPGWFFIFHVENTQKLYSSPMTQSGPCRP